MELDGQMIFDCSNHIKPFECKTCPDFRTNFSASLRNHILSGHEEENTEQKVYKCLRCSFQTFSRYLHLRHSLLDECVITHKEKKKRPLRVCYREDGTTFAIKHEPKGSPQGSLKCVDPCKSGAFVNSGTESGCSDGWYCEQCSCKFKYKCTLQKHIRNRHTKHEDIHWFQCEQCLYKSKQKTDLKRHITNCHSKPDEIHWFKCEQCSSRFKEKNKLKRHTTLCHSRPEDIRWFKCDKCSYKSKQEIHLRSHIKGRHSKPGEIHWYNCDQCPYQSKQTSNLKKHITLRHSKPEDIQWFTCDKCPFESKLNDGLKRHKIKHHSA